VDPLDVAADGRHGLSGVKPIEDGVAELVPVRHFLGVVFRVDGKRHHLGPDPFQPLDMLLKIG